MFRATLILLSALSPLYLAAQIPALEWSLTVPNSPYPPNHNYALYDAIELPLANGLGCFAVGNMRATFTSAGEVIGIIHWGGSSIVEHAMALIGDSLVRVGWYQNRLQIEDHFTMSQTGLSRAYGVCRLSDGNAAVIGFGPDSAHFHSDLWLLKWSPLLEDTLWFRVFASDSTDIGAAVTEYPNGDLLLAGETRNTPNGEYDVLLIRTDSLGGEIWSTTIGDTAVEVCYDVVLDAAQFAYLCGRRRLNGVNQAWLIKCAPNGQIIWQRTYDNGGNEAQFRNLLWLSSGNLLAAGRMGATELTAQFWLAELDPSGDMISEEIWGPGGSGLLGFGPAFFPGNGFLVCGFTGPDTAAAYIARFAPTQGLRGIVRNSLTHAPIQDATVRALENGWFAMTDSLGRFWLGLPQETYRLSISSPCVREDTSHVVTIVSDSMLMETMDVATPVYVGPDTIFDLEAYADMPQILPVTIGNVGTDTMLIEFRPQFVVPQEPWLSVVPASGTIAPNEELTAEIHFLLDTVNNPSHVYRAWLYTYLPNTCPDSERFGLVVHALDADDSPTLPNAFDLSETYPNPFNASTRITFSLPHQVRVQVDLINVLGRHAGLIADGIYPAGTHSLMIDGSDLASGIYFLRLNSDNYSATRKLLLLR